MKNILPLLLTLFLCLPCKVVSGEFTFHNISDLSGISLREINSVVRDDDGFIWAASRTGILRVASSDYQLYELPFITTDVMKMKMACRNNLLVAATQNGQLFRYNRILDRFERWATLSPRLGVEGWVTNLLIDADGKVWISTSVGIFLCMGKERVEAFQSTTGRCYITSLDDGYALAFVQSAVYSIDTRKQEKSRLGGQMPHFISSARYDARSKRVWVGTYDVGLWQYDLQEQEVKKAAVPQFPKLIVRDILIPDDSTLWVGIDGGGICILDSGACRMLHVLHEDLDKPSSLRGNSVSSLLLDDRGRIWTATNSGGLQYVETKPSVVEHLVHGINNPQSLHNNEVNHMMADGQGNLWIATSDGISRRDARTQEWKQLYGGRQQSFLSLASDGKGRIYAGTYGDGLYVLDEASGRELHHYTHQDGTIFGPAGFVFATYTDSDGDVWIGGVKGNVYCRRSSDGSLRTYDTQPVYCFAECLPGQILLGCAYGLLLLDKETGKFDVLLSNHTVYGIAVVGHTVWACTSGDGLIGLDMRTAEQTHITTRQGLPGNYTKSLLAVGDHLWVGTDKGLCRIHLPQLRIRTFAAQQLLANVSFSINAACRLPDGRIAFGSNNGAVLLHPEKVDTMHVSGRIYFSDIRVSGRSIRENPDVELTVPVDSLSTLRLSYPQNSFTLSVLPLGNVSASFLFSWKLEGQDNEWNTYTTNRYINYTNLPAGNYTLAIRLYDGGILSERKLTVVVAPPFWQTIWFRLIVLVLIAGLLFLFVRSYLQRLHRRYADEKIRFFTRMAHDIRTSLMLIKAPMEELRKETGLSEWGGKCLSLATEQTTRLSDTATQLLDFEKLDIGCEQPLFADLNLADLFNRRTAVYRSYAAGRQICIEAHFSPEDYRVQADVRMMERVIDNLLSNAVKYSNPGGRIEVSFIGKKTEWTLRIKDYGMGIGKTAQRKLFCEFYRGDNAVNTEIVGSGIGLLMTKKYVSIHGGRIDVTSQPGVGTTFDVTVPFRPASETEDVAVSTPAKPEVAVVEEEVEVHDMHILIVEDNPALCEFMIHPLREHFRVTAAGDGQQAWEMMSDLQPDLVVSDIVMSRMDGFELCRRIKSTYETCHIPVILLTALSDKANQLHGLGLGADNYLVKPFDMALLASRITSIIRNRRTVLKKAVEAERDDAHSIVANRMNDEFIKKAVDCVRANMSNESFGKEDFASALALSQSLLYKKIKALTNLSVVEFIRSIRLNYAMEKLRSGEYNVTEVSEMCGFSTPAYFSKVFKEHFGKTPTEVM